MKHPTRRTLATLTSLLASAALVTGVVASATPAQARQPHTLKLCGKGNYATYAEIPQQGGVATVIAFPNTCTQIYSADGTTYAKVWGIWNTHPQDRFYVGTVHFDGAAGWTGGSGGTTTSPHLVDLN